MEITAAAPPTLTLPTTAAPAPAPKSPDTDHALTPTTARIHPSKPLPFTNGVLKRHAPPHLPHAPLPPPPIPAYRECMKNHAASMGGHALDGCGEFMPSPSATPADPTSLKCAACGCHRNFHRRDPSPDPQPLSAAPTTTTHVIEYHPHHRHHPPPPPYNGGPRSPNSPSPPPISSSYYPSSAPHMLLALSGGAANTPATAPPSSGGLDSPHGRKRFRTKFSQEQKDKMLEFAEKLGWKMQKASDEMVAEFCGDVGVERGVFKVWMHNNKNTFGRREFTNGIRPEGGPANIINNNNQSIAIAAIAAVANEGNNNNNNGSSGNSGSHGYSKNGDGTYGSSTSS